MYVQPTAERLPNCDMFQKIAKSDCYLSVLFSIVLYKYILVTFMYNDCVLYGTLIATFLILCCCHSFVVL